jgi:hypothetical protein
VANIVISYRRHPEQNLAVALVAARLRQRYGERQVFLDHQSIEEGDAWKDRIGAAIRSSRVVLAWIDDHWLASTQRLRQPDDMVRWELVRALQYRKPVLPVLVGGVRFPAAEALPDDLVALARTQAMELGRPDGPAFAHAVSRLDRLVFPWRWLARAVAAVAAVTVLTAALVMLLSLGPIAGRVNVHLPRGRYTVVELTETLLHNGGRGLVTFSTEGLSPASKQLVIVVDQPIAKDNIRAIVKRLVKSVGLSSSVDGRNGEIVVIEEARR